MVSEGGVESGDIQVGEAEVIFGFFLENQGEGLLEVHHGCFCPLVSPIAAAEVVVGEGFEVEVLAEALVGEEFVALEENLESHLSVALVEDVDRAEVHIFDGLSEEVLELLNLVVADEGFVGECDDLFVLENGGLDVSVDEV